MKKLLILATLFAVSVSSSAWAAAQSVTNALITSLSCDQSLSQFNSGYVVFFTTSAGNTLFISQKDALYSETLNLLQIALSSSHRVNIAYSDDGPLQKTVNIAGTSVTAYHTYYVTLNSTF